MRDAGVSHAIWAQLQADGKAAELYTERQEHMISHQEQFVKPTKEAEKRLTAEAKVLQVIQTKSEHEALQRLCKREEARIKELEARAERERTEKEFERETKGRGGEEETGSKGTGQVEDDGHLSNGIFVD